MNDSVLARLYASSATSPSSARKQGGSYALANVASVAERRKKLLAQAIASGNVKPDQLGPADAGLLGVQSVSMPPPSVGGGGILGKIFGGAGHFLGNLGTDIANTAIHLPQAGLTLGKDVVGDLMNRRDPFHQSAVSRDIIEPTLKTYGETYGHGPGHFLQSFYQHPLGPILDVATIASLGGSAAARAGGAVVRASDPSSAAGRLGQRAVGITSRGGRDPFVDPLSGREFPREFTPRPVAKLGQRGLDVLTKTGPNENYLGRVMRRQTQNYQLRRNESMLQAIQWDAAEAAMAPLSESMKKLTPDEAIALNLAQRGVNTPQKLAAFQRMVHENSLGDNLQETTNSTGVNESYLHFMGNLPDHVKELVVTPNERMINAHQAWRGHVMKQQDELGITPEMQQTHLDTENAQWEPFLQGDAGVPPEGYGIEHVYTPSDKAVAFERRGGRLFNRGDQFVRGKTKDPALNKGKDYTEHVLATPKASWQYASTGATFSKGTFRTDARVYLDHASARAREAAERVWKQAELNRTAHRDPETGDIKKFGGQGEVNDYFGKLGIPKGKMVFVNDSAPRSYFKAEHNYVQGVNNAFENWFKDHPEDAHVNPFNDPQFNSLIERITDADATAFIKSNWSSMKRDGVAIPDEEFQYRMRMMKVNEPFTNPAARFLSKMMYRWRTAVLTLMPRWALNTALGSVVMNTIRGVNFHDYWIAQRLHNAGFLPEDLATPGHSKALPGGVDLGHAATQQMLESAAPGYGQAKYANYMKDLGISMPVREMQEGVQNIENFFRRAAFIHNLRRENRLALDGQGRHVDLGDDGTASHFTELGDGLKNYYTEVMGNLDSKHAVAEALASPQLVDRALRETDKIMYNYSVLGPAERRLVRQFVPFWGWYKFISMAAYRLGVELPGRVNFIRQLSDIAKEEQKDNYGIMPAWLRGSLPLGMDKAGTYTYLSMMGANPFSQIANPLGPQGTVQGLMSLGQTSPLIQGGLAGLGIDTLTGGPVRISPESGVGVGQFGELWKGGQQVTPAQVGSGRRVLMSLLRSFPEYRIGERHAFGPQYPESVPFIPGLGRPGPPPAADSPVSGNLGGVLEMFGASPKAYDLAGYQSRAVKSSRQAVKQQITARARLKAKRKAKGK